MRTFLVFVAAGLLTLAAFGQSPFATPGGLARFNSARGEIPGLVAWWKMDANTGTSIASSGPTTLTGYFAGSPAPTWTNGVVSYGLHFQGDAYIYDIGSATTQATNTCAFIHTNATFTLAVWARIHPGALAGRYSLLANTSSSGDSGFMLSYGGEAAGETNLAGLYVYRGSVGAYVIQSKSPSYWTNSAWHHIAFSCNGTSGQWYWDGVAVGSSASVGTKGSGAMSKPMRMGDYLGRLKGTLDDVRIYSGALTGSQVLSLYNGGSGTGGNP
jgi:hypothetical protein